MVTEKQNVNRNRLSKLLQAVEKAQKLQDDRIKFGLDHVNLYVENVEGDWLENWGNDEDNLLLEGKSIPANKHKQTVVQLGQWFEHIFETGWQAVEEILGTKTPELAFSSFRSAKIQRAKIIFLNTHSLTYSLVFIVNIEKQQDDQINIVLQIQTPDNAGYLPDGLQLILLSATGEFLRQEEVVDTTNLLEVELNGKAGECFQVQVVLEDVINTEHFVI